MMRSTSSLLAKSVPFFLSPTVKPEFGSAVSKKLNTLSKEVKFREVQSTGDLASSLKAEFEKSSYILSCDFGSKEIDETNAFHAACVDPRLMHAHASPDYKNVFTHGTNSSSKLLSVRAIIPSPTGMKIGVKDRVDLFPAQGIDVSEEIALVEKSLQKVAEKVNQLVKSSKLKKIFIVKKNLSRHSKLNEIFESCMESHVQTPEGVEVHIISTASSYSKIIMNPEDNEGIFIFNDVANSSLAEQLLTGLAGGNDMNFTEYLGSLEAEKKYSLVNAVTDSSNPVGLLLGAARILDMHGCKNDAKKVIDGLRGSTKNQTVDIAHLVAKKGIKGFLSSI